MIDLLYILGSFVVAPALIAVVILFWVLLIGAIKEIFNAWRRRHK
jgi:hypothetical protein